MIHQLVFRPAVLDDLPAMAELTRDHRQRLAGWSPRWWSASPSADVIHPMWLEHLIVNVAGTMHIAVDRDGTVDGCLGVTAQRDQWFIDDVALGDVTLWASFAAGLVRYVDQRPALTCVATEDRERSDALRAAGCAPVSSYWIRETTHHAGDQETSRPQEMDALIDRAPHTFGGSPLDHEAAGALAFSHAAGSVIGSPSIPAPPVYHPGGTVAVADLVRGPDRHRLLDTALDLAGARGDVLLNVVCATDDHALEQALQDRDFARTVDVHRLPDR